eukprot:Phypoly_transcript_14012.p1 GENE.Phypoly_transcript_14012~~Phypoly_transcript_14012.p1  ORF type:complete len:200 (+),score=32.78 Phypoly_transcript_14012:371-970(+)
MDRATRRIHAIQQHLAPISPANELQAQSTSNEVLLRQFIMNPKQAPKLPPVKGLAGLKEYVGKELGVTDYFNVSQERINAFADTTGDFQWIHVDVERASNESPFGGPIAHGLLTLSLAPYFVSQTLPQVEGVKYGVNYGFNKVRYVSPVKAGANVRGRVVLQELTPISGGAQVIAKITFEIEGSDKPAAVAESVFRMYM